MNSDNPVGPNDFNYAAIRTAEALHALLAFDATDKESREAQFKYLMRHLNYCTTAMTDVANRIKKEYPNLYPVVLSEPLETYLGKLKAFKHDKDKIQKVLQPTVGAKPDIEAYMAIACPEKGGA